MCDFWLSLRQKYKCSLIFKLSIYLHVTIRTIEKLRNTTKTRLSRYNHRLHCDWSGSLCPNYNWLVGWWPGHYCWTCYIILPNRIIMAHWISLSSWIIGPSWRIGGRIRLVNRLINSYWYILNKGINKSLQHWEYANFTVTFFSWSSFTVMFIIFNKSFCYIF